MVHNRIPVGSVPLKHKIGLLVHHSGPKDKPYGRPWQKSSFSGNRNLGEPGTF